MRTKILAVLAEASEPLDIQAIAEGAGAQVKSVSEALSRLNKDEFVDNLEKGFWQVKDEGRQELNRIREQEAKSKEIEQEPTEPHGEMETVPSQSDLFRSIGEKFRRAPQGQFYRLLQLFALTWGSSISNNIC